MYANRAARAAAHAATREANPTWAQWKADTAEMEAQFSYLRSLPFWRDITDGIRAADSLDRLNRALRSL
jgi:hypothetical protein